MCLLFAGDGAAGNAGDGNAGDDDDDDDSVCSDNDNHDDLTPLVVVTPCWTGCAVAMAWEGAVIVGNRGHETVRANVGGSVAQSGCTRGG